VCPPPNFEILATPLKVRFDLPKFRPAFDLVDWSTAVVSTDGEAPGHQPGALWRSSRADRRRWRTDVCHLAWHGGRHSPRIHSALRLLHQELGPPASCRPHCPVNSHARIGGTQAASIAWPIWFGPRHCSSYPYSILTNLTTNVLAIS